MKMVVAWIAVLLLPTCALAHQSHTAVAEMEWNSQSQVFEVSMRLHIADLEDAISVRTGRKFRVESSPNVEQQVHAYLQDRFRIQSPHGVFDSLNWVGMELELHDTWVYFEVGRKSSGDSTTSASQTRVERWEDLFSTPKPGKESTAAASMTAGGLQVTNSVLFEVQPEQKNVVTFTQQRRSLSAVLLPQRPTAGFTPRTAPQGNGWQRR